MAVTDEKFEQIQKGLLGTGELPERIPDEDIGLPRVVGTVPRPRTIKETFVEAIPEFVGMLGSIAAQRIPGGGLAVKSLLGAGAGGMFGEAVRQAITGEQEKLDSKQKMTEIARRGLENAVLDGAGNLIFSAAGSVFKLTAQTLKDMGVNISRGADDLEIKQAVQKILQEQDIPTTLSRYQVTGSALDSLLDIIGRVGFTGKATFETQEKLINKAISSERDKILDTASSTSFADDVEIGSAIQKVVEEGHAALSSAVSPFYTNLSTKAQNVTVNFNPIKSKAQKTLNDAAKVSESKDPTTQLGSEITTQLKKIADLKDDLSFADAFKTVSFLKKKKRSIETGIGGKGNDLIPILSENIVAIEKAMDSAAKKLDPNLYNEYRMYSSKYREGMEALFPEQFAKIISREPERIGEAIYKTGNVTTVQQAFKAIDKAVELDPRIQGDVLKNTLRRGYLEQALGETGSEISFKNLLELSKKVSGQQKQFGRTYNTILDDETKKNVKTLTNIAKVASKSPKFGFSLMIAGQQASAIRDAIRYAPALIGGGTYLTSDNPFISVLAAGGTLMAPKALAKIALNSDAVNKLVKLEQLVKKNKGSYNAGHIALALDIFRDAQIVPEDLILETPMGQPVAPQGMSTDDFEEIKNKLLEE
jgi:hypothetical protein